MHKGKSSVVDERGQVREGEASEQVCGRTVSHDRMIVKTVCDEVAKVLETSGKRKVLVCMGTRKGEVPGASV